MLHLNKTTTFISLAVVALLSVGCGSSDDSTTNTTLTTEDTISGQLIDGYISGAHYICEDGKDDFTAENGEFSCETLPITFSLGSIQLGKITLMPQDNHIFPQDLLGLDRNDTNNSDVLAMAQLLQSLDSDNNPENGIELNASTMESITLEEDFDIHNLDTYLAEAGVEKVTKENAYKHLEQSTHTVETIENSELPELIKDSLNTTLYTLSEAVENDIAYMGNEERMAYDIYNALSTLYPTQKAFENVPQKSEIQHINAVKALVTKYDLSTAALSIKDINVTTLNPEADLNAVDVAGVYGIQAVQDLYDTLLTQGENSEVEALQVGCIVEVTDIDDLNRDIIDAEESNATDVVDTFNFLRDGSYSHYWSFDTALKNIGEDTGCCSLGDEYCKTEDEYPKTEHGSDVEHGSDMQDPLADGTGEATHDGQGYRGGR